LLVRLPSLNASGTITFDQLDVHAALYVPLAGTVQQKAEVQGNVRFNVMYVNNPVIIFSKFQAEGDIVNLAKMASRPTIPWAEVLTSPYNILFNIFFLSGVAIQFLRKRKTK